MMNTENPLFSARILLVDDDDYLRSVLSSQLRIVGVMAIEEITKAREVFEKMHTFKPDLILLDSELPDGNGFDVCKRLRALGFKKPIIMLTDQKDMKSSNKTLNKGANDFINKPMRFVELLSLVRAQIRQYKEADSLTLAAENVEFQPASKTLTFLDTQSVILLTEKETMMLKKLFHVWPEAISKDSLLSEVWGYQNMVATHTLETHIYRLRQKIARVTEAPLVETTQDGYRLVKNKNG